MATEAVNRLKRRADAITVELEEMNSNAAGGKPNAPGKNIDHVGYRLSLYQELDLIDGRIAMLTGGAQVDVIGRI